MKGYKVDLEDYDRIFRDATNEDNLLPVEQELFPLIDPRIKLPKNFPNIENLKYLGEEPLEVNDFRNVVIVQFSGGEVEYSLSQKYGFFIPSFIKIYGVLAENGRPALNTERYDTDIALTIAENPEVRSDNMLYYKIIGGPTLEIEIVEGEKEVPKEWWYTERRN